MGPAPAAPPGYPQAAPGYGQLPPAPRTDSRAIVGLVLSLGSWMLCPVILAIVALVLAGQSDRAIAASGGWLEGRTINTATRWISWINIVVMILLAVVGLVILGFAVSTGSSWEDPAQF